MTSGRSKATTPITERTPKRRMGFHDKAAKPHLAPDAAATQERVARPRDLLPYLCTTNAVQAKKRKGIVCKKAPFSRLGHCPDSRVQNRTVGRCKNCTQNAWGTQLYSLERERNNGDCFNLVDGSWRNQPHHATSSAPFHGLLVCLCGLPAKMRHLHLEQKRPVAA